MKAFPVLLLTWLLFTACGGGSGADLPTGHGADPGGHDGVRADPGAGDARPDGTVSDPAPETGDISGDRDDSPDAPPRDAAPEDPVGEPGAGDVGPTDPGEDTTPDPSWHGLFDPDRIRDPATAECAFFDRGTVLKDGVFLDTWRVSYLSWESIDGTLRPIRIRGFAAKPAGSAQRLPGIVQAHGLGGHAEESHATGTAALLRTFVLAFTGPGGGTDAENTSEGLPSSHDDGYRMFDTLADPRGSWFWAHAVAALRGLTCLAARPDVDAERLGLTGYSAGGVVTLVGAAVDDRVRAAVPLSASGAWDVAVQAPNAWQHALLDLAGLSVSSPEWTALIEHIDSSRLLGNAKARILMVNGSADEFFPLTAHDATFAAIPGDAKRTAFVGNLDHGCYTIDPLLDKAEIETRATIAAQGGQRMWFANAFGTDPDFAYVPTAPWDLTFTKIGDVWIAHVRVDDGGPQLSVEEARLWASTDAKYWASLELVPKGGGIYGTKADEFVPQDPSTLVHFVDATYRTGSLVGRARFSISTRPSFPAGHVPAIRDIQSCL